MAYIVPTLPETLEDRVLYTQGRLAEVACLDCRARVMVRKNSEHHTSIQWTEEAVADCAYFDELARQDDGRPDPFGLPAARRVDRRGRARRRPHHRGRGRSDRVDR